MRTFRTPKNKRTNYNYYSVTGKKIEITPDEVGTAWVAKLHEEDDAMHNSDDKEARHIAVHYGLAASSDNEEFSEDKMACLADPDSDPLNRIIESFDAQKRQEALVKLKESIQKLQPQQIDLIYQSFYARRTNVDIAKEQGVTEAAIRNRLKKIYIRLYKLMLESGCCYPTT